MQITRWDAFQELAEFERQVDRMLGRRSRRSYGYPPIDLVDIGDAFQLIALIPGADPDHMNLSVTEKTVLLSGRRKSTKLDGGKQIYRERPYGEFQKRIDLPEAVRDEEIDAKYTDGVLQVTLPKRRQQGPRRITVQWGR